MYFPIGWPKYLQLDGGYTVIYVSCNRDRSLFAVLSDDSISIWNSEPCVQLVCHQRNQDSIDSLGINRIAEWRPDSSMVVITTSKCHLLFYQVQIDSSQTLYEQQDSKIIGLKRESAELFSKRKFNSVNIVLAVTVCLQGDLISLVYIRDELMVATSTGQIWRIHWSGTVNEDYSLDLNSIPFCTDQQQSRASLLDGSGLYVKNFEYTPLIGGFSIVLSNGKAAFITATTLRFDPKQVVGIWAQEVNNATCTAVNHRYRLIAYGLKNAEGIVYCHDDLTGALQVTHRLMLSSKDFPDVASAAGSVAGLKWTPDGIALAMIWEKGGLALWSVFGALLTCTLGWDYGSTDVLKNNPFRIKSLEWGPEGYHLWMVTRHFKDSKEDKNSSSSVHECKSTLGIMQFAKSALTVNTGMTGRKHVLLQAEDKLFISTGADLLHNPSSLLQSTENEGGEQRNNSSYYLFGHHRVLVGNKQWIVVTIPYTYLGSNWPIRYTAIDPGGKHVAVAGQSGLAHYSLFQRKWKLFGNETQEQEFVVMGGLLWWDDHMVLGCYNLRDSRDEIRIYPQETKLDNQFVRVQKVPTQVLQLSVLRNRLLSFCADSHITLYHLQKKTSPSSISLQIITLLELDVSNLVVHPACVVSAVLTSLHTESVNRSYKGNESILLNVCGRLLLIQRDPAHRTTDAMNNNQIVSSYCAPTVLASNVENLWVSSHCSQETTHLTEALWIACGANGMRVWLPLFPHDGEKPRAHNFMSKRIMLPIQVHIYPLAVLFEDAVILGAENDTVLFMADIYTKHPYCVISRTSQVYLPHILRQLLRRNLGSHAWEIARSCATLPYFPHSLELLLHEVLEEEATSSEPIPDALLPRVIDFIQEFPVFLQTVVQCARKTELALWPYLFSAVGNPKNLFQACLRHGHLETAASYLIILQNMEKISISRHHATLLLDSSLEAGKWELSNDLVRFLKAIDPNDVDSTPRASMSFGPSNKYSLPHSTPPVSPTEDDLSFVLGTVSLTRGRTYSGSVAPKTSPNVDTSTRTMPHQDAARKISDPRIIPSKKPTVETKDKGTPEDFFIDTVLARHARKLLAAGRLRDLGFFAAHLDYQLVSFFRKERARVAKVEDYVSALRTLHQDFQWPFPIYSLSFIHNSPTKKLESSRELLPTECDYRDHMKPLSVDVKSKPLKSVTPSDIRDSGYLSNNSQDVKSVNMPDGSVDTLSTQTIEAQLVPKEIKDDNLTMEISEDSSLWGEDSHTTLDDDGWTSLPLSAELEAMSEELANRGPPQTEVQLRYFLQLMIEAGCLEWALLIAVVLRDAMAVIRVVNATKQPDQPRDVAKNLRKGLIAIEQWSETECLGYKPFMLAISNQAKALSKINNSSPPVLELHCQSSRDPICENSIYESDRVSQRSLSITSEVTPSEGSFTNQEKLQEPIEETVFEENKFEEAEEAVEEKIAEEVKDSECILS